MNKLIIASVLAALSCLFFSQPAQAAKGKQEHDNRGMSKIEGILDTLNLSTDQTAKCSDILSAAEDKIRTLMSQAKSSTTKGAKGGGDRSELREKVRPILVAAIKDIKGVLTADQNTKFDAGLKELREQRRQEGGASTTQPAGRGRRARASAATA